MNPPLEGLRSQVIAARRAARRLATLSFAERGALLSDLGARLAEPDVQASVMAANSEDLQAASLEAERGTLSPSIVKRLGLDAGKFAGLVEGLSQLAGMADVVGRRTTHRELDTGLVLERVTCPLGVMGVVFEARPESLIQITALAWKSGNAVILKGGREARRSNRALTDVAHEVLRRHGLDPRAMLLLEERAEVDALLALDDLVDLVIARGGSSFIAHVRAHTDIPVMAHADGICHVYLHSKADPSKAAAVTVDAKTTYPAACNAVETVLWDEGAGAALDATVAALASKGVELRGCPATLQRHSQLKAATDADWDTEYGALVLSIKRVAGIDEALEHIESHGSRHTEAIVSEDAAAAERFLADVDAACVFHNASTRFNDGFRFGLGAEVGISTDKLHARGPVGLDGLVTYRWLLRGDGHVTASYAPGGKKFTHRDLG